MPEAVIVDTVRTPIGRAFKGSLSQLRPDDIGAWTIDQPQRASARQQQLLCQRPAHAGTACRQ